jgi:hypothetical protein
MDSNSDETATQGLQAPEGDSPAPTTASDRAASRARAARTLGVVIIVILSMISLSLAFRSGAYGLADWLPHMIGVAALAVVVSLGGPAVFSDRLQKIILALFAAQAVWTAASILWATSAGNAWEEINRTLFYAVTIALVFAAVRWAGSKALTALATLITVSIGIVALVIALSLWTSDNPVSYFEAGRLNYPVTYFNGLAALLMLGFWLALGMATGARGRWTRRGNTGEPADGAERRLGALPRWAQPLLLALAVILAELALLPQSRGALWTLLMVVPFFVILSNNRFRALIDLAIVGLPVVLFWNTFNGPYAAISDNTPLGPALSSVLRAIGYSVLIVVVAWAVTWLAEREMGPLPRRVTVWTGVTLIILVFAGMAGGLIYADQQTGGLGEYLGERWGEFSGEGMGVEDAASTGSRLTAVGLNGRVSQWRVAALAFADNPLLGIGAQNYEVYYYQHRTTLLEVRQPHSQPVQLLAELGLPGVCLWLLFVVLTLVRAVTLRFRSSNWAEQATMAAIITAAISWFIHSSADWLWQLAAVSLPAAMLFGGMIGAGPPQDRRAPVLFSGLAGASGPRGRRAKARNGEGTPRRRARIAPRVSRALMILLGLLVGASAMFPYLSLTYSDLAAGSGDLMTMTAESKTAATLDPTSIMPYSVRASAHSLTAMRAPEGSLERVEQFRLAAAAWVDATEVEPGVWLYYYQAAETYLRARDAALALGSEVTVEEMTQLARTYLNEADHLNPLSPQVDALGKGF